MSAVDKAISHGNTLANIANEKQASIEQGFAADRRILAAERSISKNSVSGGVSSYVLIRKTNELEAKNAALIKENEYFRNLLTKDMLEIANENGDFKETYHKQQELLGNWMVSQRAFKEIAIKFGLEMGKTKEEVVAEGNATKIKVLDGETEHGNNFVESEADQWEAFYAPRIKTRFGIK